MAKATSQSPLLTTGKSLIALVNIVTLFGPYLADWNSTHIHNPTWPPHARYHNGQTMSLGLFVGLVTYYTLFSLLPRTPSVSAQQTHLNWILVLQNLVYLSSLSGILYPGAGWTDEVGGERPQLFVFPVLVGVTWVGWWVERERLGRVKLREA